MPLTPGSPVPRPDDGLSPVVVVLFALFVALATSVMVVALLSKLTA